MTQKRRRWRDATAAFSGEPRRAEAGEEESASVLVDSIRGALVFCGAEGSNGWIRRAVGVLGIDLRAFDRPNSSVLLFALAE